MGARFELWDIAGMSSKFLERLDEIREGAPPQLGFGPAPRRKTPGLALIVSAEGKDNAAAASGLSPDAVIVSGVAVVDASEIGEAAGSVRWGARAVSLSAESAAAWREAGADPIVFSLADTALGAVTSKDAARVLMVDAGLPPKNCATSTPCQWTLC